jgi:multiple sugar transport system permease protein
MNARTSRILAQARDVLLLSVGAAVILLPYLVMVSMSLKSPDQIYAGAFQFIPDTLHWRENFVRALTQVPLMRFMFNGLVMCGGILLLQLLTAVPCAYALAKLRFRGRETLFALILGGLLIPYQVTAIPLYVGVASAGLLNTYSALIAPFATSVFAVFLFRQFFRGIPDDLIHAARLDGLSEWSIVWRMVLPLAYPAVTAFAVFSFVAHWNDLFWPMVVVTAPEMATPPLGVLFFRDQESGSTHGPLMAGTVLITAPLILAFLFAQKKFIDGITLSGMKG